MYYAEVLKCKTERILFTSWSVWSFIDDEMMILNIFSVAEIPPAERITTATHANNANKVTLSTTEQIEISK